MEKRMNKYKAIHEHCQKENEQHDLRMTYNVPNLTDMVVRFQDAKGRHVEKKCQKK